MTIYRQLCRRPLLGSLVPRPASGPGAGAQQVEEPCRCFPTAAAEISIRYMASGSSRRWGGTGRRGAGEQGRGRRCVWGRLFMTMTREGDKLKSTAASRGTVPQQKAESLLRKGRGARSLPTCSHALCQLLPSQLPHRRLPQIETRSHLDSAQLERAPASWRTPPRGLAAPPALCALCISASAYLQHCRLPDSLGDSLAASGCARVRLVRLCTTDSSPHRMLPSATLADSR